MVNFNSDITVGTPAVDVERISILQRRYDLIEALEFYKKNKIVGANVSLSFTRARLISLFLEVQAVLKRRFKEKQYEDIKELCFNGTTEEDILKAIYLINEELDILRLTRIDTQKVYDSTDVEAENEEKGF